MRLKLSDPGFLRDPFRTLAALRAEGKATGSLVRTRLPLIGPVWLTTTDAGARHLLKADDVFVRDPGSIGGKPLAARFWWLPGFLKPLLTGLLSRDGADHARLRRLVDGAFTRPRIEALRPRIEGIADRLLDGLRADRPCDLVAGYARPLPLLTICALLGVPAEDEAKVAHWIAPVSGPVTAARVARALPGLWRLTRYFRADFAAQRRARRDGLIGDLVHFEVDGDRLSDDDLLAMVVLLFMAGHETTVHLIGNAVARVLADDALRQTLTADPARVPVMIEEVLRHASPVAMTKPLYATQDTVLDGQAVRAGEAVMGLLLATNHDPARHVDPERFVADRRPNPHLGFGFGPHVCLGMHLARVEAEVALVRLLGRFPQMQAAGPAEPLGRVGLNGVRRLPVRLAGR